MTWFDVLISQMSVFILFVSAGVVFDGAFPLWVSLNKLANYYKSAIMVTVFKKSILEKFSLKQVSKEVLSTYMFE